ncbi:type III secretion system export apparatus subunit SctS [Roseateles depolymerans]|uniref:Type III secretion protein, HrpO family n=1 Tax=Roseateles depolymerans TaxID=76731 RepID=A0A0U3CFV1_9BURK|nr:type III secretion system export apparatus subunit SctS [Roseateles depolymerans]ALV07560.1 Type III secretion protein, HrpO family [Roseateles depolymerans]REG22224.1 type III secretion protein S [Roseateles depolymerans]
MNYDVVVQLTSEALLMCVVLSLPAVVVSAVIGLLVSFFQAITSLQDSSISQGIKLLAVTGVVVVTAPWAGSTLMKFSENLFTAIFQR